MSLTAIVTTKVIDERGCVDDDTAITHQCVADDAYAIQGAMRRAGEYMARLWSENKTDAFDLTVEIKDDAEESDREAMHESRARMDEANND